jgi:hypothetical protein
LYQHCLERKVMLKIIKDPKTDFKRIGTKKLSIIYDSLRKTHPDIADALFIELSLNINKSNL